MLFERGGELVGGEHARAVSVRAVEGCLKRRLCVLGSCDLARLGDRIVGKERDRAADGRRAEQHVGDREQLGRQLLLGDSTEADRHAGIDSIEQALRERPLLVDRKDDGGEQDPRADDASAHQVLLQLVAMVDLQGGQLRARLGRLRHIRDATAQHD